MSTEAGAVGWVCLVVNGLIEEVGNVGEGISGKIGGVLVAYF